MSDADAAAVGGGDVSATTVEQQPPAEAPEQVTSGSAVDPPSGGAVVSAPVAEKIANGSTDAPPPPPPPAEDDEAPFELKHLIENRAAFKRLKDEIEGDIVRIDRDIAAHRAAFKKARCGGGGVSAPADDKKEAEGGSTN